MRWILVYDTNFIFYFYFIKGLKILEFLNILQDYKEWKIKAFLSFS